MSTILAAPFRGEFGWEIGLWVPWLRWMRRNLHAYKDFEVTCRKGHEELYSDFATRITPLEERWKSIKRDCQQCWINGALVRRTGYGVKGIYPEDMKYHWAKKGPPRPTKRVIYRKYGSSATKTKINLIAFHARQCKKKQPERNWRPDNWKRLAAGLMEGPDTRIASIGHKDEALHVHGTEDMRGVPLEQLTEILSNCRVVYGPSSGPLHLANHCGTPVVWWSGNAKDMERYATAWNPFKVVNRPAPGGWQPSVDQVLHS